jgi:hypothetical protein
MARPMDTTAEAWAVQRTILRRMTGAERAAMAVEMSETARLLTEAGIRHRHPEWSDQQIRDALLSHLLGSNLAEKVRRARDHPVKRCGSVPG